MFATVRYSICGALAAAVIAGSHALAQTPPAAPAAAATAGAASKTGKDDKTGSNAKALGLKTGKPADASASGKPDAAPGTADEQAGSPAPATGENPSAAAKDWRVSALPPDAAYAAFQRGYFVTAFRESMKRIEAEAPDAAAAMTLIAELYRDGLGFKQDPAEAARWYKLAAERGNTEAAFALGRAYLNGSGLAKDVKQARALFETAAAKGHGKALYNLGVMALEPIEKGKAADFETAASLFARAAEAGDLDASYSLALLYRSGQGVEKNDAKAAELLRSAAQQHHLVAMTEFAIALFNGKGVAKNEAAGARFMTRAAWRNSPVAQNRLARMYAAGRGVKRDMMQAMKWHIIARASGIKDQWLDDQLPFLTRTQRKLVDEQVRKFAGK